MTVEGIDELFGDDEEAAPIKQVIDGVVYLLDPTTLEIIAQSQDLNQPSATGGSASTDTGVTAPLTSRFTHNGVPYVMITRRNSKTGEVDIEFMNLTTGTTSKTLPGKSGTKTADQLATSKREPYVPGSSASDAIRFAAPGEDPTGYKSPYTGTAIRFAQDLFPQGAFPDGAFISQDVLPDEGGLIPTRLLGNGRAEFNGYFTDENGVAGSVGVGMDANAILQSAGVKLKAGQDPVAAAMIELDKRRQLQELYPNMTPGQIQATFYPGL